MTYATCTLSACTFFQHITPLTNLPPSTSTTTTTSPTTTTTTNNNNNHNRAWPRACSQWAKDRCRLSQTHVTNSLALSCSSHACLRASTSTTTTITTTTQGLAKSIAWDGEGATCLMEVAVSGAKSDADARTAAKSVAGSSLVKSAIFGHDPNWGRIAAAAGYSGGWRWCVVLGGGGLRWWALGRGGGLFEGVQGVKCVCLGLHAHVCMLRVGRVVELSAAL